VAADRIVHPPKPAIRLSEIGVIGGNPSIDSNRPADQLDRGFVLTPLMGDQPEKVNCARVLGIDGKCLAIKRLGLGQATRLMKLNSFLEDLAGTSRRGRTAGWRHQGTRFLLHGTPAFLAIQACLIGVLQRTRGAQ
jgi:hypothetical protein